MHTVLHNLHIVKNPAQIEATVAAVSKTERERGEKVGQSFLTLLPTEGYSGMPL